MHLRLSKGLREFSSADMGSPTSFPRAMIWLRIKPRLKREARCISRNTEMQKNIVHQLSDTNENKSRQIAFFKTG